MSNTTFVPAAPDSDSRTPSRLQRWASDMVSKAALPAAVMIAAIILWGVVVAVFDVPAYLVPSPSSVWHSGIENIDGLYEGLLLTSKEVLVGFALAAVIGIPLGIAFGESRLLQRAIYPLMVVAQIVPKVSLAPLMIVWFGLGLSSKIVFIVLISFFPVVVNTMVGVASASADFRRLAKSVGLGGFATLRKVTLPQALPSVFAGLKVGITLAVIGAVVAEFIAAQGGLGFLILIAQGQVDTAMLFAAIIVLTLMGLVFYGILAVIEKLSMPWNEDERS